MLESYDVCAFVIATDAERAKQFYGGTLGLKFMSQDQYAVVFDANGIMLRVGLMPNHKPEQHTVLGWNVPDIRKAAADLVKRGVQMEKYPFLEQDEQGIWTPPGSGAKVAWFKDPDGNVLSIAQH